MGFQEQYKTTSVQPGAPSSLGTEEAQTPGIFLPRYGAKSQTSPSHAEQGMGSGGCEMLSPEDRRQEKHFMVGDDQG